MRIDRTLRISVKPSEAERFSSGHDDRVIEPLHDGVYLVHRIANLVGEHFFLKFGHWVIAGDCGEQEVEIAEEVKKAMVDGRKAFASRLWRRNSWLQNSVDEALCAGVDNAVVEFICVAWAVSERFVDGHVPCALGASCKVKHYVMTCFDLGCVRLRPVWDVG